jgi:hypothetical protein
MEHASTRAPHHPTVIAARTGGNQLGGWCMGHGRASSAGGISRPNRGLIGGSSVQTPAGGAGGAGSGGKKLERTGLRAAHKAAHRGFVRDAYSNSDPHRLHTAAPNHRQGSAQLRLATRTFSRCGRRAASAGSAPRLRSPPATSQADPRSCRPRAAPRGTLGADRRPARRVAGSQRPSRRGGLAPSCRSGQRSLPSRSAVAGCAVTA